MSTTNCTVPEHRQRPEGSGSVPVEHDADLSGDPCRPPVPRIGDIVETIGSQPTEPAIVTEVVNLGTMYPDLANRQVNLVVFTRNGGVEPMLGVWHESVESPQLATVVGGEVYHGEDIRRWRFR